MPNETAEVLRDLVDAIEKKADIGKRRALTVSPLMEEVLERARERLSHEGYSGKAEEV